MNNNGLYMSKTEALICIQEIEMLTSSVKEEIKDVGIDIECKAYIDALLKDVKTLDKNNRWIPVSERLPEVGFNVLITAVQHGNRYVAEGVYEGNGNWSQFRWSAKLKTGNVVAWQPLPEPYKGA